MAYPNNNFNKLNFIAFFLLFKKKDKNQLNHSRLHLRIKLISEKHIFDHLSILILVLLSSIETVKSLSYSHRDYNIEI
ncbi:hypothetical protein BpHYR1_010732 [Brachionus plicatilis]|uniref:Uncharacterized protein n=1 Tax=Brachionus plicatilis TaxID=10195 RepID=A0A3M7SYP7_BRAPC|nr:hypothetical protein BpHYR1_010732 [Brachionus plicatilis]